MTPEPLRIAVLVGSTRPGRIGLTVANWLFDLARQRADMTFDLVDLAEIDLPHHYTKEPHAGVDELRRRLGDADGFIVVTPEYNHGYPAALKHAIDFAYVEWRAKPVALVSYGGISGGLRAVEQLRQVFAELHAVTLRDTVSFHGVWSQFDAHGQPVDPDGCNAAAKTLLDQLRWWTVALRDARRTHPYAA